MYQLSAHALRDLFLKGEISAKEIAEASLKRIAHHDSKLGSFLSVFSEKAIEKAKALDEKRSQKKKLGKLAGVPTVCQLGRGDYRRRQRMKHRRHGR